MQIFNKRRKFKKYKKLFKKNFKICLWTHEFMLSFGAPCTFFVQVTTPQPIELRISVF